MHVTSAIAIAALAVTCVNGYPNLWNGNHLTPVHGLYVKPSSDGTTGDLFVAATEDSGVKSQWAVDQPINFIPVATAAQPQATAVAIPCQASQDDSSAQKRAVVSSPVPSQPFQYAYALQMPASNQAENTQVAYAYPVAAATTETPKCDHTAAAHYPYQFPYQLFYPQMMSAYTNAMSILKDAGMSEDKASNVMAQATPTWPSYAYPMYVMVDPNAWNQNQVTTTSTPPTPSANTQSEETTQP